MLRPNPHGTALQRERLGHGREQLIKVERERERLLLRVVRRVRANEHARHVWKRERLECGNGGGFCGVGMRSGWKREWGRFCGGRVEAFSRGEIFMRAQTEKRLCSNVLGSSYPPYLLK